MHFKISCEIYVGIHPNLATAFLLEHVSFYDGPVVRVLRYKSPASTFESGL